MKEEFRLDGGGGITTEILHQCLGLNLTKAKEPEHWKVLKRNVLCTWSELGESANSKCSLLIFNLNKLRIYTYSFSFPTIEKTVNSARKEMEKIQISLCSHFLLASLSVIGHCKC